MNAMVPPMFRQEYVNGFLFSPDRRKVVLIEKKKFPPGQDWSRAPYNGIGGKIELGESPTEAMAREFSEEAGVRIAPWNWRPFAIMDSKYWVVHYFKAFDSRIKDVHQTGREPVVVWPSFHRRYYKTVHHLAFLLPLALYADHEGVTIIKERTDESHNHQATR
jgi:8-oxo-dGTP pyrophosphatase MutT (NUDIX family)